MQTSQRRYLWIAILILAMAVTAAPRFDRHDLGPIKYLTGRTEGHVSAGDSPYYTNYVEYFRGQSTLDETIIPFRYRPVTPFLASLLPVDSAMTSLNIINLLLLYLGLWCMVKLLLHLGFSFDWAAVGGLLYAASFPVLYYGCTGYVDASAIGLITVGTWLVFTERWWQLAVLLAIGAATKEIVVLVVPVAFGYLAVRRGRWFIIPAILSAAFLIPTYLVRTLVTQGDGYYWTPGLETLIHNLRFRAIASSALSFGISGLLSLGLFVYFRKVVNVAGYKHLVPLFFGVGFTVLLLIYSMLTAYTDGRFVWPMITFTIPLGLWVLRDGILAQRRPASE
jgi:hypothetical protein